MCKPCFQKYLTEQEFAKLRDYFKRHHYPNGYWVLMLMAKECRRIGEVIGLKRSDISHDFSSITFHIEKKKDPYYCRSFPIAASIREKFKEFVLGLPINQEYLFKPLSNSAKHPYISAATMRWYLFNACCKLGYTDVFKEKRLKNGKIRRQRRITNHTFRSYGATQLWEISNHNAKLVQDILDHEDISCTFNHYIHSFHKIGEAFEMM